jgi:glycosyltransferase involved in cell wall biosynthesis
MDGRGMSNADVCLILEGTYPYVTGGVSSWTHDLLLAQADLRFHLVTLLPKDTPLKPRYEVPRNVIGQSQIFIQKMREGSGSIRHVTPFFNTLEKALLQLQARGGLRDIEEILRIVQPVRSSLGHKLLMNSQYSWQMQLNMYNSTVPASSFLDFFWSWRSLIGGMFSVLLADLPQAGVYHAVSTGYAGLFLARAKAETGRPGLITEHGIYTNERRIEMAMANWLHDTADTALQIDRPQKTLKDLWVDTFIAYSHACYEACSEIITLYAGNQQFQLQDGAPPDKLRVIPNGIDFDRYAAIPRSTSPRAPTIALIGRVVPIKDVKTFIRACAILKGILRELEALVLGPTEEDETYFRECQNMVQHLFLHDTINFAGQVKLEQYLGRIDVIVLTSISEAQPLVVLEAGAVGIPSVTTDVGSCRELLFGRANEDPPLGPGGDVTPLCNPSATAHSLARLLTDAEWYERCSRAIKERVRLYYNKKVVDRTYRELYGSYLDEDMAAKMGS